MSVYLWAQELDPEFPLAVLEYQVNGDGDRMHWHEHLEIALCLEGTGRFLFGRRAQPVEPGDIFIVDNSQPHVALANPGVPLRLLLVLFRPELVAAPGCRPFESGYLAPFHAADEHALERIPRTAPLAADLAPILRELRTISARNDPDDRHLLDANLRLVLGLLGRNRGPCAGDAGRVDAARADAARREQIRPVFSYVEQHCRERVTLDEVAEVVHLSPSRVRHVFRDVSGVGFKEYATRVRLAEAKRLLLATDLSVAEVAHSVGYTNVHQFYTVFQRYYAQLPAEYRRYYTVAAAGDGAADPAEPLEPAAASGGRGS
ncbi:MAG TPA: AraC family transcriptional regulator [Candidatus Limnocylindrales bacterium]|nr:AraC family transcriptional regulator [Candidatus Limnocylindrales bacterium]